MLENERTMDIRRKRRRRRRRRRTKQKWD